MHLIFLNCKSIITYLETVDGLDYFKLDYFKSINFYWRKNERTI